MYFRIKSLKKIVNKLDIAKKPQIKVGVIFFEVKMQQAMYA